MNAGACDRPAVCGSVEASPWMRGDWIPPCWIAMDSFVIA
jgi:hypothetical protein